METFITYRDEINGNLEYCILQREFPHCVGVISQTPIKLFVNASPIAGYNLWVCFNGTLRGMEMPAYKNIAEEISATLDKMANWYIEKRIRKDEKKYKKWKIGSDVSTQSE